MLSATDPLLNRPARVLVAGASGSGKTTLAARTARVLGVPHTEIDGLYHGPDWTPCESFVASPQTDGLRRRLRREVLWNANIEPLLWTFFTDPEHVIRWAWKSHGWTADRVADLRPDLPVVRLNSRVEVDQWVKGPLAILAS